MQRQRLSFTRIPATFLLAILLYLCSLALIQPPAASAHAFVIGSDPVDGSTIARKPAEVRIRFNAAISSLSSAHVYYIQQGQLVDVGKGPSTPGPSDTLVIPLQPADRLAEGSYEVLWSAVAQNDGHVTHGIIGFNIGFSSTGISGTAILGPSTSNDLSDRALSLDHATGIPMALWEWFTLLALTFWIGMQVMERLVLADGGRGHELLAQARQRSAMLLWLCPLVMLAGDAVLLFLRALDRAQYQFQGHFSLSLLSDLLLQTNYGHIWLIRVILLLVALGRLYWDHLSEIVPAPPKLPPAAAPTVPEQQADEIAPEQKTPDTLTNSGEQKASNPPTNSGEQKQLIRKATTRDLISRDVDPPLPATPPQPWPERAAWLLLAGALALLFALTSPAQMLQPRLSALFFSWLNVIALGLWFGELAYLAVILLPLLKRKELDFHTETLLALQRRLLPFLLTGMGMQIACAFFLSDASISGLQQFLSDPYGIALIVLLAMAGLMLLLSLYVLFLLRPRLIRQILLLPVVGSELPARRVRQLELERNGRRLKLLAGILALLGTGVLLCMSLLSYFAPPIVFPNENYSSAQEAGNQAQQTRQTKQLGDLSVTVEVLPGQSGVNNTVIVLITDRSGQPVTDAQVRLTTNMQTMDMGTAHATIQGGQPVYAATFSQDQAFNMIGLWRIDVEIDRAGQPTQRGQFQIMLMT